MVQPVAWGKKYLRLLIAGVFSCVALTAFAQTEAVPVAEGQPAVPAVAEQPALTPATDPANFKALATFRSLNKITAQVSSLKVRKGTPAVFGNLTVALQECWKAPPEEQPENKALVEIWEQVPGEQKKKIFHGWMFASSPSLSGLEHPVYDLTLRSCDEAAGTQ